MTGSSYLATLCKRVRKSRRAWPEFSPSPTPAWTSGSNFRKHAGNDRRRAVHYYSPHFDHHERAESHAGLVAGGAGGNLRWIGMGRAGCRHARHGRPISLSLGSVWSPTPGKAYELSVYLG